MGSIAIVGGGFSGTMVAAHLLRSGLPVRVTLIERLGPFGGGVAYGTRCASHVLNVPCGRMSAFEDDPDHFLGWLRQRDPAATGGSFVSRPLYGQYLRQLLAEAESAAATGVVLERVPGEAVAIRPLPQDSGVQVSLGTGGTLVADGAVLAVGNYPPADPDVPGADFCAGPGYVRDPWAHDALRVDPDQPVLLIGTGLTMLDIALALRDQGHRAPIHAVSRRGLLPQPHRASPTPPPHLDRPGSMDRWERTALGLLRGLRREAADAARRGIGWREVVTSIRADTPALWASLGERERRRFLEHLRPFWETHRHRAAPEAWAGVEAMMRSGRLRVRAARIAAFGARPGSLEVSIRPRGSAGVERLSVARVINCTGPDTDLSRIREPLIASLRDAGLIRPDPLGLGLDTDAGGALIDARGHPSQRLFLAGPLRKGSLWENTAVPELRVEARRLAARIAGLIAQPAALTRAQGPATAGAHARPVSGS